MMARGLAGGTATSQVAGDPWRSVGSAVDMAAMGNAMDDRDRFRGCLLGGAIGDALGAPVEFLSRAQIVEAFGAAGVTDFAPAYGATGRITDDTQMTLFTAAGLLNAVIRGQARGITSVRSSVACAYLRWRETQGGTLQASARREREPRGWLMQFPELWHRRAPGATCLRALESMRTPGEPARNDSKGCGGVMRAAPVGLAAQQIRGEPKGEWAFARGVEIAALTHGHPTGQLPAGVLAMVIARLCEGASLRQAIADAKAVLASWPDHRETLLAIDHAQRLAAQAVPPDDAIPDLGEGWVAEEALAIAVYCALVARDFAHGVLLAVNHGGDSDSTGAIAGNLLGTLHGMRAIPQRWRETVELRDVLVEIADDLEACGRWPIGPFVPMSEEGERLIRKYPA